MKQVLAVWIVFAFVCESALATTCPAIPVSKAAKESALVFIGSLESVEYVPAKPGTWEMSAWHFVFRIQAVYAGASIVTGAVEVFHPGATPGGNIFTEDRLGQSFLVFADRDGDRWITDPCLPNQSLGKLAAGDLDAITGADLLQLGIATQRVDASDSVAHGICARNFAVIGIAGLVLLVFPVLWRSKRRGTQARQPGS